MGEFKIGKLESLERTAYRKGKLVDVDVSPLVNDARKKVI